MINIRQIIQLSKWWAERLPPQCSSYFKESFTHELSVILHRSQKVNHIILQTHPRLSQTLVEVIIFAAIHSDEKILADKFITTMMSEYHYSKVCDGHVFVEENRLDGFSPEIKLLLPDGSVTDFCDHCYTPIDDGQGFCNDCMNDTAICVACRKPRAIPTIGLDGVCEGCMQVELNNQLYELGEEHERRWASQVEAW